jgi:hypothetical protein
MKHAGCEDERPRYDEGSLGRMIAVRIDVDAVTGKQSPAR